MPNALSGGKYRNITATEKAKSPKITGRVVPPVHPWDDLPNAAEHDGELIRLVPPPAYDGCMLAQSVGGEWICEGTGLPVGTSPDPGDQLLINPTDFLLIANDGSRLFISAPV